MKGKRMKAGTKVRVKQPVIAGEVMQRRINPQTDELEARVEWEEGGEKVSRWFDVDMLEALPAEEPEPEAPAAGNEEVQP